MKDEIFYYDARFIGKNKPIRKLPFETVFKHWVDVNGGPAQFLRTAQALDSMDLNTTHFGFLKFFCIEYHAVLPRPEDQYYQEHLFDDRFYNMHVNRLKRDYEDRFFAPGNIAFIVLVSLALIGLVSLCS